MMKRKYEYIEGSKARENFERTMKALFQAGKPKKNEPKRQPKKATSRKSSGKNEG